MVSFDPSIQSVIYTLQMLAASNFASAAAVNREWLERLQSETDGLIMTGTGTNLSAKLRPDLRVMRPHTEPQLGPGEWDGIGSYFEIGMVLDRDQYRAGYDATGQISAVGVAVAHHREMPADKLAHATRAWDLFTRLREEGGFPLRLIVDSSYVSHVYAGAHDIVEELAELTQDPRVILTELAIGSNHALDPHTIDWTLNCQINEGAYGIHVGIGNGVSGAHIDFICPGVAVAGIE